MLNFIKIFKEVIENNDCEVQNDRCVDTRRNRMSYIFATKLIEYIMTKS